MPFVKPKLKSYKVIAVGENVKDFAKLLDRYWMKHCLDFNESVERNHDNFSCVYTGKDLAAKINIWILPHDMKVNLVMPNYYRRTDVFLDVCSSLNLRKELCRADHHFDSTNTIEKVKVVYVVFAMSHEKTTMEDICNELCTKRNMCIVNEEERDDLVVNKILLALKQQLMTSQAMSYNEITWDLDRVELDSDKMNLTNETRCFERNGIA